MTFLAMELIRGARMSDVLAARRPAPVRAIELGIAIAETLAREGHRARFEADRRSASSCAAIR